MPTRKLIRTLRAVLWAALLLTAAAAVGLGVTRRAPRFHGTSYEPLAPAPDFRLVDHQGRPATLASFAGSPTLLFFGYTRCPDVCPTTLARLRRLSRDLPGVRIALVSVDPAHDTPAVLAGYVARFGPSVTGLTGDSAAAGRAMTAYGAYTMAPDTHGAHRAGRAMIGHSSVVYGLDSAGNLRVVMSEAASEDELRDDIRTLARL